MAAIFPVSMATGGIFAEKKNSKIFTDPTANIYTEDSMMKSFLHFFSFFKKAVIPEWES